MRIRITQSSHPVHFCYISLRYAVALNKHIQNTTIKHIASTQCSSELSIKKTRKLLECHGHICLDKDFVEMFPQNPYLSQTGYYELI